LFSRLLEFYVVNFFLEYVQEYGGKQQFEWQHSISNFASDHHDDKVFVLSYNSQDKEREFPLQFAWSIRCLLRLMLNVFSFSHSFHQCTSTIQYHSQLFCRERLNHYVFWNIYGSKPDWAISTNHLFRYVGLMRKVWIFYIYQPLTHIHVHILILTSQYNEISKKGKKMF